MPQTSCYPISCPKCGETQEVDLVDALRIGVDPDLREALLANELNKVTCTCGFAFRVDKNLLYHDDTRRVMIYLMPAPIQDAERIEAAFFDTVQSLNKALPSGVRPPRVMLVLNRTELIERIFLIEAGLDERVIEYVKYTIYTRNLRHVPFADKVLLFNAQDSNEENLAFVVMDAASHRLESMIQYKREAYRAVADAFNQDDKTGHLLELFPGPYISARRALLRQDAKTK